MAYCMIFVFCSVKASKGIDAFASQYRILMPLNAFGIGQFELVLWMLCLNLYNSTEITCYVREAHLASMQIKTECAIFSHINFLVPGRPFNIPTTSVDLF